MADYNGVTIQELPAGPLELTDVFIATTTLGASKKVTASEVFGVQRVATFAAMEALIVEGRPSRFTVEDDEHQRSLPPYEPEYNVPYLWDGVILLEYYSSPCDRQPNL